MITLLLLDKIMKIFSEEFEDWFSEADKQKLRFSKETNY